MKNSETIFYGYVLLDPRKSGRYIYDRYAFEYEPFYVGKGSNARIDGHRYTNDGTFKYNIINKITEAGLDFISIVIETGLTELQAFSLEKHLIKLIGRRDLGLGPLANLTDGGEGASGAQYTRPDGWQAGKNNSMFGKQRSNEVKQAVSRANRGKVPWNKGKKHKKETIEKIKRVRKAQGNRERKPVDYKKLSEADIVAIFLDTRSRSEIAKNYPISISTIWNIKAGKTWKKITDKIIKGVTD
jgi:NUMOD3 motif